MSGIRVSGIPQCLGDTYHAIHIAALHGCYKVQQFILFGCGVCLAWLSRDVVLHRDAAGFAYCDDIRECVGVSFVILPLLVSPESAIYLTGNVRLLFV